jgi:uncharacterized protein (TIGR02118 family)
MWSQTAGVSPLDKANDEHLGVCRQILDGGRDVIKSISVYSLPAGTDPDEFWKYHTEVHAKDVVKIAGPALKKYTINRVVEVRFGQPKFWGVIEMWWESKEAARDYIKRASLIKTPNGKGIPEDFGSRVIEQFGAQVEEKEIPLR